MDTEQRFALKVSSDAGVGADAIKEAVENIGGDVMVELVEQDAKLAEIPAYALKELVEAAIEEGAGDRLGAAIAHIQMLARQQGIDLRERRYFPG